MINLEPCDSEDAASTQGQARREFLRLALISLPATGLLAGCVADAASAPDGPAIEAEFAGGQATLYSACPDDAEREQRTRWAQLHAAYLGAENAHDLPSVLAAFGPKATMIVNDRRFEDAQSIADMHALLGMSSAGSGLANTQVIHDREFFTDDELLVYGRVLGTHVGRVLHFPPTLRAVELHYSAFYRFDSDGKIITQRVVMNWAPLAGA
jgi:hypothetical protein